MSGLDDGLVLHLNQFCYRSFGYFFNNSLHFFVRNVSTEREAQAGGPLGPRGWAEGAGIEIVAVHLFSTGHSPRTGSDEQGDDVAGGRTFHLLFA